MQPEEPGLIKQAVILLSLLVALAGLGLSLWITLQRPDAAVATPSDQPRTAEALPPAHTTDAEEPPTTEPDGEPTEPDDVPTAQAETDAPSPEDDPATQDEASATPNAQDNAPRRDEPARGATPESLPEELDTYLVIGDSQVQGGFGQALDYMLRAGYPNSVVSTYGICSSSPMSWTNGKRHTCGMLKRPEDFEPLLDSKGEGVNYKPVRTPRLLWLMHSHRPEVLVIGLGENGKKAGEDFTRLAVSTLIRNVDCYRAGLLTRTGCKNAKPEVLEAARAKPALNLKCFWVLPPLTRAGQTPEGLQTYLSWFTETIGDSCQIIDSRPLTCTAGLRDANHICERDSAGIHFSPRRARLWAFATFDTIVERLGVTPPPESFRREVIEAWGLGI